MIRADDEPSPGHAGSRVNGHVPGPRLGPDRAGARRARRPITGPQRLGAVLIAAACVFAAVWYVPRIAAADSRSLAGTVTSSGVVYLNFSGSGQLAAISARVGQQVRPGQLLATEAAPQMAAVLAAARAAIGADKAELAAEQATGSASATAAARVQLARDQAQLAVYRAQDAGTRITAPAAGTVIAVNGQPGEAADPSGVRDYAAEGQGTPVTQQPVFSLFPEGPQSGAVAGSSAGASLPVIALRTSAAWQVRVLVPAGSLSSVRPGQEVTIDVPGAGISGVPGRVQELLTTPVATVSGLDYQAVVTAPGDQRYFPPSGLAADVQLGS